MQNSDILYQNLQQRILVLDGAMGTMLQRYQFTEEDYGRDLKTGNLH